FRSRLQPLVVTSLLALAHVPRDPRGPAGAHGEEHDSPFSPSTVAKNRACLLAFFERPESASQNPARRTAVVEGRRCHPSALGRGGGDGGEEQHANDQGEASAADHSVPSGVFFGQNVSRTHVNNVIP